MFVPRALRLKGVKEAPKPKPAQAQAPAAVDSPSASNSKNDTHTEAAGKTSTTPASNGKPDTKAATRGPRFNSAPVTSDYLAELAAGVELIFTDYAHQAPESAQWLQERSRSVEGEEKFVHLSAILEHSNIVTLKPQPTQILLKQAIEEHAAETLELSSNGFYVRRTPSTYPLSFVPQNSFNVVNDNGLSFWDQRTIYVEPHIRYLCKTPAKVAHWLKEHGQLKAKWLPIQAVQTLYNSCAFVVLSGNVTHEDVWEKWRDVGKPEDWKIMTKVEHTKRTEEYLQLLKKNNAHIKRQPNSHSGTHGYRKFVAESAPGANASGESQQASKKRKRPEEAKGKLTRFDTDAHATDDTASETGGGPLNEKRA
ncbi:hypothetical protein CC80DRAFT_461298 [Byssothecium circinans]|uniref:Uncharacterized protein n=1 Tax=Byssothecium circinans TaxID=147558 RepID=A0A6A5UGJ0_9PLEO|nr:hypothetical protein CC80DRAFT_461298 [Byssothecium circinans]